MFLCFDITVATVFPWFLFFCNCYIAQDGHEVFLRLFSICSFIFICSMFSTSSVSHYLFIMPTIWFLHKTRYDKKDTTRLTLFGLQLISAMSPPGGGRNPVTSRFLRHFNIITITKFSDDTLVKIFGSIMNHNFRVKSFIFQFWLFIFQWIVELLARTSTARRLVMPLVQNVIYTSPLYSFFLVFAF